jgi:hypothetical protein
MPASALRPLLYCLVNPKEGEAAPRADYGIAESSKERVPRHKR